ncbi:unnamed protein product [Pleuronectes platessa]|uniref:Uncharacterized protein n=1 Tax=Pleuronectes platessa TaxID=8262 RepID=A0A9N7Y1R6_PLEPL|nr:unnamed protein product [Pleuronectes platessa]
MLGQMVDGERGRKMIMDSVDVSLAANLMPEAKLMRVTWSREPGATAGASSRTKHSEHGHTEGLVPPPPGSVSSGCLLTERTRTLLEDTARSHYAIELVSLLTPSGELGHVKSGSINHPVPAALRQSGGEGCRWRGTNGGLGSGRRAGAVKVNCERLKLVQSSESGPLAPVIATALTKTPKTLAHVLSQPKDTSPPVHVDARLPFSG